jgi:hypothetical protein
LTLSAANIKIVGEKQSKNRTGFKFVAELKGKFHLADFGVPGSTGGAN